MNSSQNTQHTEITYYLCTTANLFNFLDWKAVKIEIYLNITKRTYERLNIRTWSKSKINKETEDVGSPSLYTGSDCKCEDEELEINKSD